MNPLSIKCWESNKVDIVTVKSGEEAFVYFLKI